MRDKRQKFVELAEARVRRVMKELRLVGNLSNRSSYEFTEEDVKKIFRALQKELDTAKGRFGEKGGRSDGEFSLEV